MAQPKTKTAPAAAPQPNAEVPQAMKPAPDFQAPPAPERRIDAHRAALQRAAQADHARRMDPASWTPLPNGEFVRNRASIGFKHPGQKVVDMMTRPADMILREYRKPEFTRYDENLRKDVQCGHRYVWMVRIEPSKEQRRDAETSNLHRGGRIRYVETKEINPDCDFAVYTPYATVNNEYVTHAEFILCEIQDPQLAYDMGPAWVDYALSRVQELPDVVRGEPDTHLENTDVSVELSNTRQEASGPMYRAN